MTLHSQSQKHTKMSPEEDFKSYIGSKHLADGKSLPLAPHSCLSLDGRRQHRAQRSHAEASGAASRSLDAQGRGEASPHAVFFSTFFT